MAKVSQAIGQFAPQDPDYDQFIPSSQEVVPVSRAMLGSPPLRSPQLVDRTSLHPVNATMAEAVSVVAPRHAANGVGGGVLHPLIAVPGLPVPTPLCEPTDTRIDQNAHPQDTNPSYKRNDPYDSNYDKAIARMPEDTEPEDRPSGRTPPPHGVHAATAPTGFALYPRLRVVGEHLDMCVWRQVFFQDTQVDRWSVAGLKLASGASHATGTGKFNAPRPKGAVDWGVYPADRPVTDSWTYEMKERMWVRLRCYLRDQVSTDDQFRTIILCRDYSIEWKNFGRAPGEAGSEDDAPPYYGAERGREAFSGASGQLVVTIGPLKYTAACEV